MVVFVWARWALNREKRRFPARAVARKSWSAGHHDFTRGRVGCCRKRSTSPVSLGRFDSIASEKDTKLAQKLAQLQPFMAVFPQEYMGQLAYFGPPNNFLVAAANRECRRAAAEPPRWRLHNVNTRDGSSAGPRGPPGPLGLPIPPDTSPLPVESAWDLMEATHRRPPG